MAACGGDDLLLPSSGQPAHIEVFSGNSQTGTVGQTLGQPLVVRVTDREDRPVEGNEVVFIAPPGAGLAPNDTVLTDPEGKATVQYTLATVSGEQVIEARAKPAASTAPLATSFSQIAESEAATDLLMAGGDGQTAEVRTALPDSLAVKAVDRFGNGVAGIEVTWEAAEGVVSPVTSVTGADGRAATQRLLGPRTGSYPTTASAELQGSPVRFGATGIAPPSPQLTLITQPSVTASAGVVLDRQPVLQLLDAVGAPLLRADVAVTAQIAGGGGSLGGSTTASSNAEGRVTFADLSIRGRPGRRTLLFAAVDFTPVTSDDIEVSAGVPAPGQSTASVPNGTAGASTRISVRLADEFGSPVEGAAGSISIAVQGANPAASLTVTDEGDGDYSAAYVPTHTGTDQVDIRVDGTRLGGSPFSSTVAPGPADASKTTATVNKSGAFFTRVDATVTARDAQNNLLGRGGDRVEVLVDDVPQTVNDNGDGTYTMPTVVTLNFSPTVVITLNGSPISGSPFRP